MAETTYNGGTSGASTLSPDDLRRFRFILQSMRNKILGTVSSLTEDGLQPMPLNDDDPDIFAREFALDIAGNEQEVLKDIEDALDRMEQGAYGICEASGKPISRERLLAVPYARYSVEAQARMERDQRSVRNHPGRAFEPWTPEEGNPLKPEERVSTEEADDISNS